MTSAASAFPSVAAGFGLGIALAGAPGPVQAILLTESVRGGIPRGVRAQLGANLTFLVLLVALALGVSLAVPEGIAQQILRIAGGAFLIWLGIDGYRSGGELGESADERPGLPPALRGTLAVVLNPGAWIFLATAASSLLSTAARAEGTATALAAALAMTIGVAMGDTFLVLFGGLGLRRAGQRTVLIVRRGLAVILAGLGGWLILGGVFGGGL